MIRKILVQGSIMLIRCYQRTLSWDTGYIRWIIPRRLPVCAFYPTCSEYAIRALQLHGFLRGCAMAIRRVIRCHPWQKPTIDIP